VAGWPILGAGAKLVWSGHSCPLAFHLNPRRLKPRSCVGRADAARVELVPFPVLLSHRTTIRRELPETAEVRAGVQGSFDCACGFIRRIPMLRSG
jgi:hypothetical protein